MGATIIVDGGGGGDYTHIQWAVQNASSGDTILIRQGSYSERITIDGKSLKLIGDDANSIIIQGDGAHNCLELQNSDNNRLENLTVQNGDYGIHISDSHGNNLTNLRCPDNQQGIYIEDSDRNILENVTISNAIIGLHLKRSQANSILNSSVKNNNLGINLFNSPDNLFEKLLLSNNGLQATSSANNNMRNSTVTAPNTEDFNLSSSSTFDLVNSSYDRNSASFEDDNSLITVRWLFEVIAKNTLGQPVTEAVVRIRDNENGSYDRSLGTGADGRTDVIVLTEYTSERAGMVFFTPYNVSVSKDGYGTHHIEPEPELGESAAFDISLLDIEPPRAHAGEDVTVDQHTLVTLNGSGSSDNLAIDNYTWNLTYNGSSFLLYGMSPDFLFHEPGRFRADLNVTDHDGNRARDVLNVTVNDTTLPVPMAGDDVMTEQHSMVTFNASDSSDNVGIEEYRWNFSYGGGEHVLYGIMAQFLFDEAGKYTVTLNVTDLSGNTRTDQVKVTVLDITRPVASAGNDIAVDEGTTVHLNGSHSSDNVGIMNHSWDFTYAGKNVTLYGPVTEFTFHLPGSYGIILTVRDAMNNSADDLRNVTVRDITNPVAVAGEDLIIDQHVKVWFSGYESYDNVGITEYLWIFDYNGTTVRLVGATADHTFHTAGRYDVLLRTRDEEGNYGTDSLVVLVRDITSPVAVITPIKAVDQFTEVILNGSGSRDDVAIASYLWTVHYGDEIILLAGAVRSFRFDLAGNFTVRLDVSDEAGNEDSVSICIEVLDRVPPLARIVGELLADEGDAVILNGSYSADNIGITGYSWTWFEQGEPMVSNEAVLINVFEQPGIYAIRLNVTDAEGQWNTDEVNITIRDITRPVAAAGGNHSVNAGGIVLLDASNSTDNTVIENYTWSFRYAGKDVLLYGRMVEYTLDVPGTYTVTLSVKDGEGNQDDDMMIITVRDGRAESPEKNDQIYLWVFIPVLVIIIIAALVLIIRRRRGRKRSGSGGREGTTPEKGLSQYGESEEDEELEEQHYGPIIPLKEPSALKRRGGGGGGPIITVPREKSLTIPRKGKMVPTGKREMTRVGAPRITPPKNGKPRGRTGRKPSMGIADSSVTCKICFGAVKTGTPVVNCKCGKDYHRSCAVRVGECPGCEFDFCDWLGESREEREGGKEAAFDPGSVHLPSDEEIRKPEKLYLPPATYIDTGEREKKLPIDEIFLMTSYGLLIEHYTFNKKTELDEDMLCGMLSAVTNFMCDAMGRPLKKGEREKELKKIDYGDVTVMFANGEELTIVGMVSGPGKEDVLLHLEEAVKRIEKKYIKVLRGWDGEVKKLEGVKLYMEELVLGEYA